MDFADAARAVHLDLLATCRDGDDTILLFGPYEPGFWVAFSTSPEYADGAPDPMDRWSKRIIGALATGWGGAAVFPSDGPPYPPFIKWALGSDQIFASPVGLLVHNAQGLWTSFRGAVRLTTAPNLPIATSPCRTCATQPCTRACPAKAMKTGGYDTDRCHALLNTPAGQDCMSNGCAVRRACPVSAMHARKSDQSEFHMKAFHPA